MPMSSCSAPARVAGGVPYDVDPGADRDRHRRPAPRRGRCFRATATSSSSTRSADRSRSPSPRSSATAPILVTQDHIAGNELVTVGRSRTRQRPPRPGAACGSNGAHCSAPSRPVRSIVEDRFSGLHRSIACVAVVDCGFRLPDEPIEGADHRGGRLRGAAHRARGDPRRSPRRARHLTRQRLRRRRRSRPRGSPPRCRRGRARTRRRWTSFDSRSTSTVSTPATVATSVFTAVSQCAQLMPGTLRVTVSRSISVSPYPVRT